MIGAASLRHGLGAVRAADWWSYKIPPLLLTAYAGALLFGVRGVAWQPALIALGAVLLVAVSGYVLNDVTDIEADRRAGMPNRMAHVPAAIRPLLVVVPAAAALWLTAGTGDPVLLGLVFVNLLLPALYSIPPIRLKGRGLAGALADAGGVHAVPMAIMARAIALPGDWTSTKTLFVIAAVALGSFNGLRGIIVHQVADLLADRAAGVRTYAARIGTAAARRLALRVLLPLEAVALSGFLALTVPRAPVVAVFVVLAAVLDGLRVARGWVLPLFEAPAHSRERYVPLASNEWYEVWLPLGFATALVLREPSLWWLLPLHLVLFRRNTVVRLREAVRTLVPSEAPPYQVIIGATTWTVNGVNVFSVNLARTLVAQGVPTHILLTEQETDLVQPGERPMPTPDGVPFQLLPVGRTESWGAHWGAMIRYLEEAAPCLYIPNSDWRHSCVVPRLSDNVIVVGVVHSDDPLHYDHVRRLGKYWDMAVAVSDTIARRAVEACPDIAGRIATIPIGVPVPAQRPPRQPSRGRLRAVYHGVLKQHQKRVLDLPRIAAAAVARQVPLELTIVGAGPDEAALREAAAPLVAQGVMRFTGAVSPDAIPAILEVHDVYLLASEFEGMPNALIEAMGRGCVPVVSDMESGIPELVEDGRNGLLAPVGDAEAFAAHLQRLAQDPDMLERLSTAAHHTAVSGPFRLEAMTAAYREVFERAWQDSRSGRYRRPTGPLDHPPPTLNGESLFPVPLLHHDPELGDFANADEAEDCRDQLEALTAGQRRAPGATGYRPGARRDRGAIRGLAVFVSAPVWAPNGVNRFAEDLVRGLRMHEVDARILVTEESTPLVQIDGPRMAWPDDLPIEHLRPAHGEDCWGARWGALLHRLEEAAPCVYLPGYDWRHAGVIPMLSNRVMVAATIPEASPVYLEQVARLGPSCEAIVAGSREVARHLRREFPALRDRLATIPHGIDVPSTMAPLVRDRGIALLLLGAGREAPATIELLRSGLRDAGEVRVTAVDPDTEAFDADGPHGVTTLRHPNRRQWLDVCTGAHLVVALDGGHDTQRALAEAMARGALPLVAVPGDPAGLVEDGVSGWLAPGGVRAPLVAAVAAAWSDPDAWHRMRSAAFASARRHAYRADQMIEAYLDVMSDRLHEASIRAAARVRQPLRPPPPRVGDIGIFGVALEYPTDRGVFPSERDALRFEKESGLPVRPLKAAAR